MNSRFLINLLPMFFFAMPATAWAAKGYQSALVGNAADVTTTTRPLIVAQGGGTDVDENFVRMGADAGGGDFVVIRFGGTDAYNPYIYALCGCDSVETIIFKNKNGAYEQGALNSIRNAEALWIAGGDQSEYLQYWKGTPVEDAIQSVIDKGAPVGGTSAGMAVLSQFMNGAYTNQSLTSAVALADPYTKYLTLDHDFLVLPWLDDLLTDTHFIERDRMGRFVTMLARIQKDGWSQSVRGIAANSNTALHIDPTTGMTEIVSTPGWAAPYVYFVETPGVPDTCSTGKSLNYKGLQVTRLAPGDRFDLSSWTATGGISYTLDVVEGILSSSSGSVY